MSFQLEALAKEHVHGQHSPSISFMSAEASVQMCCCEPVHLHGYSLSQGCLKDTAVESVCITLIIPHTHWSKVWNQSSQEGDSQELPTINSNSLWAAIAVLLMK